MMKRQRRNIESVKKLDALQHVLFALPVQLKDVLKMGIRLDGIISPVGNTSAMNVLTTITEAIKMVMRNIRPGKGFGQVMVKVSPVQKPSWLINSFLIGCSAQSQTVVNGVS